MRDMHNDSVKEYQTIQQVESALKQYIVEAIDPD